MKKQLYDLLPQQIDFQRKTFVAMPCFETTMGCHWEVIFTTHAYKSGKRGKKHGNDNN